MYSVQLKNTQALFKIERIDIKNFYAYLQCSIQSPDEQYVQKGFTFRYVFNDRDYPIGVNRYWVDTAPIQTDSSYTEINTNKLLKFTLKINLFGGNLVNLNLVKNIYFQIYESNQLDGTNERLFWTSPEILLISKNISTPATTYQLTGKNKTITLKLKHNWFSDYDFNYYSDDFKTIVKLKYTNNEQVALQTKFINKFEQEFVFDNINDGYYFVEVNILLFNGFNVYTLKDEIYIQDEKPKGFIKKDGKIILIGDVYHKAEEDDVTRYWVRSTNQTVTRENGAYWAHIIGTYDVESLGTYEWPAGQPYSINVVVAWIEANYPSYNYPLNKKFSIDVFEGDDRLDRVFVNRVEEPGTIKYDTKSQDYEDDILRYLDENEPPTFLQDNTILKVEVYEEWDIPLNSGGIFKYYKFLRHEYVRLEFRPTKKIINSYGILGDPQESVY